MLVPLIPFFLVARLPIGDRTWPHGPEFVFEIESNLTFTPMSYDDVQRNNYTFAQLLCQPKSSESLICHLDNVKKHSTDQTNDNQVSVSEVEILKLFSGEPFEIKFNESGIEHLIVDGHVHTYKLNNIKSIVELLSIGADLTGIPDGNFEAVESSTIGRCNVTFDVRHYPSKGAPGQTSDQTYELESLPQLNKVPGETIKIEKEKNLNNCSCYASTYYGSYGDDAERGDKLGGHLASSVSLAFVSDTLYVASIMKNVSMGSYDNGNYSTVVETITLMLKNIRPANGVLPVIPRAAKTSIVANSEVEPIHLS